jgi:hypothetical protein
LRQGQQGILAWGRGGVCIFGFSLHGVGTSRTRHLSAIGVADVDLRQAAADWPNVARGLALGLIAWTPGQVPVWLRWYAQQPWPGSLVVKQLALELVSSILIGLTIAFVAGVKAASAKLTRALSALLVLCCSFLVLRSSFLEP